MLFTESLPSQLAPLTAAHLMSTTPLHTIDLISRVRNAEFLINHTKHNSFPVVDCRHGTLRSIKEQHHFLCDITDYIPTGTFLGLISRRHLTYCLTSMPCFGTARRARGSEIVTTSAKLNRSGGPRVRKFRDEEDQSTVHVINASASPLYQTKRYKLPSDSESESRKTKKKLGNRTRSQPLFSEDSETSTDDERQSPRFSSYSSSATNTFSPVHFALSASARPASNLTPHTLVNRQSTGVMSPRDLLLSPQLASSRSPASANNQSQSIEINSELTDHWLNLNQFIDRGPYIVQLETSAARIWNMFRSIGMRHICVVDSKHRPQGIITRSDFSRVLSKVKSESLL